MKYIIEIEDVAKGLWRAKGFNTLVFDQKGLNKLTPYKEPKDDARLLKYLDAAYKNGYEDGKKKATDVIKERASLGDF